MNGVSAYNNVHNPSYIFHDYLHLPPYSSSLTPIPFVQSILGFVNEILETLKASTIDKRLWGGVDVTNQATVLHTRILNLQLHTSMAPRLYRIYDQM